MSVIFDEYGRPFIIMREQQRRERLKGLDAQKANIMAARTVSNILKTSLGPKGMDKMLVSPDGEVTITNDGATILDQMDVQHQIGRLMVELARSQDAEVGDGTTGVVVLAGALLQQAEKLLDKGIHATTIARGFEDAAEHCVSHLDKISTAVKWSVEDISELVKMAETTLSSKIVSEHKKLIATIAVQAVLQVADLEHKDVNLDLIHLHTSLGADLSKTELIQGIILSKDFSHPQMSKTIIPSSSSSSSPESVKVCILTCAFEPPKPKTKHKLEITSSEDYKSLVAQEKLWFEEMINKVKSSGAEVVFCQWGFDDEANHLLYKNGLNAVRWVGGLEIESLAMSTSARIVPNFDDLNSSKLGVAKSIKEVKLNTFGDNVVIVETDKKISKAVTILVRGSNDQILAEAKRSIHDAICVVRNLIRNNRIVFGGGSSETSCAISLNNISSTVSNNKNIKDSGINELCFNGFADALLEIPSCLANNSGFKSLATVSKLKAEQIKTGKSSIGVDCFGLSGTEIRDMNNNNSDSESESGNKNQKEASIVEGLESKKGQISLAAQLVKMVLKIDDVISPADMQE